MKTISEIREGLLAREFSCRELTEEYLCRAEKRNPELNCYIRLTPEKAFATADAVDRKLASGGVLQPLEGIPYSLKDIIAAAGEKLTCGSKMLENYEAFYDAFVYEKLKAQGAVMIGKANMDEFAMGSTGDTSYFGPAKNPCDVTRAPGGSSSGSASSVAGGLAAFSLGTDTGGSVRVPAAFCGVCGLKPTYGAVSRRGVIAFASSLDQVGPIAANIADLAAVFDAINDRDTLDMTCMGSEKVSPLNADGLKGKKIAVVTELFDGLPEKISASLQAAIDKFRALGAEIHEIGFEMLRYSLPVYYIVACAEASSNLGRYDGIRFGHCAEEYTSLEDMICKTRTEGFGAEVRRRILLGTYVLSAGYSDAFYKKAQRIRTALTAEFADAFTKYDLLLMPIAPVSPPLLGQRLPVVEGYHTDLCTVCVNLTGIPAISMQTGGTDEFGLPVGMQLLADKFKEKTLFDAAYSYERGL